MTRKRSARTTIPKDFEASPEIIEWAKREGYPDPRTILDNFKDYHLAHGSLMADWEAAFRTWLRRERRLIAPAESSDPPPRTGVWNVKLKDLIPQ